MRFLLLLFVVIGAFLAATSSGNAATLIVEVSGIRSSHGTIRLALFPAGKFLDFGALYLRRTVPAMSGSVYIEFDTLPEGTYSLSALHDENSNGTMDKGLLGIPSEGVGVSNNARGFFGPPSAAEVEFKVSEPHADHAITLTYY